MTYEKSKLTQNTHPWNSSIEEIIIHLERVTNGNGTPYSDEAFSEEPPGVIKTIIRRLSLDETISSSLKAQLKLCERRLEYIVQPCWHEGYNACSSLKKQSRLELELVIQTGYIEARYRYTSDQAHWYWFLAGWLSACRTIN
jgi:hypothetical protein